MSEWKCPRCLGTGFVGENPYPCPLCSGIGTATIATPSPAPPPEERAPWRCRRRRSHGICNALNGADETNCGACGEDRPSADAAAGERPTTHARNCPELTPNSDDFCNCGLIYRQQLWDERVRADTNWTMYMAWRKRAEEAKADCARLREALAQIVGITDHIVTRTEGRGPVTAMEHIDGLARAALRAPSTEETQT